MQYPHSVWEIGWWWEGEASQAILLYRQASGQLVNPFLFIKNKRLFISLEGFSALEKMSWYVLRGQGCSSSQAWQPSADSNGRLAHFLKNLTFLGRTWEPAADSNGRLPRFKFEKSVPNGHYYLQRAVTPYRSPSRIVCRGQESPKGSKGTLWPDFQSNTRPRFIFKTPMSQQDTGRQL